MAGLRVRRVWWIMAQGNEAPLFRTLSRKWRPVDRRERTMTPFALALPGADVAPPARGAAAAKKKGRMALLAEALKKSKATWNPWRMTK
jgi:hypothetical protein